MRAGLAIRAQNGLRGIASSCLGLLILQTSISFLPDIVVLKYFTTTRLILSLGLISLLALRFIEKPPGTGGRVVKRPLYLLIPIALFLAWSAISSLYSLSPVSFSGFRLQAEEVLAFLLVVGLIRNQKEFESAMLIFLVALSIAALVAIKQVVSQENTNFFLVYQGRWVAIESLDMPKGAIVRASGHFNNPNILAAYLILLIPIATASIKRLGSSKWTAGAIVLASVVALALTFSRGAIISLLTAIGVVLVRKNRRFIFAVPLLALTILVNPFASGRLGSTLERLTAWSTAFNLIAKKPFLGVGLGNFRRFAQSEAPVSLWHAHNLFLNVAAEVGLVAVLALLAIIIIAIWSALDLSRLKGYGGFVGLAFASSFIAFSLASLVDNPYNSMPISYTFWLLLGLLVAGRKVFLNPRTKRVAVLDLYGHH